MPDRPYRVLFCGSRNWAAPEPVRIKLEGILEKHPDVELVHGAGRGLDMVAGACAESLGIPVHAFPADWERDGKAAGPLRNQLMLEFGVDAVYAFKEGFIRSMERGGTEDMVRRATEAGVPCQVVDKVYVTTGTIIHQTIGRDSFGMTTSCGLSRQHYSTCSGFHSMVTCPECLQP
jgi:hypothetical protein